MLLTELCCQVATGRRDTLTIFGADYDTAGGTCIPDYIHASDLADAHVKALEHLAKGGGSPVFNYGYGHGYSVKELVDAVERVLGHPLPVRKAPLRRGRSSVVGGRNRKGKAHSLPAATPQMWHEEYKRCRSSIHYAHTLYTA